MGEQNNEVERFISQHLKIMAFQQPLYFELIYPDLPPNQPAHPPFPK